MKHHWSEAPIHGLEPHFVTLNYMRLELAIQIIVAAANMAVGIYVFLQGPRSATNRSFLVFVGGIVMWSIGLVLILTNGGFAAIVVALWGGEGVVLGLVMLAEVFPAVHTLRPRFFFFFVPLFALGAVTPSRLIISFARFDGRGYLEPSNGPLFPVFVLILGAYIAWGFGRLFLRYRELRGIRRVQMRCLIIGLASFVFFGFLFDVLLPAFHIFRFNLFGPLFSAIFIALIAYAIVKHQFMDIRLVIRRSASYALTVFAIALIFFCTEFVIEKFIYANDEVVDIIAAMVGALLFAMLRSFFETATDRIFFRGEYNYSDAVGELGEITNATIDLDALLGLFNGFLMRTIKPVRVEFFLDGARDPIVFGAAKSAPPAARTTAQVRAAQAYGTDDSAETRMLCDRLFSFSPTPFFIQETEEESGDPNGIADDARAQALSAAKCLGIAAVIPLVSNGAVRATMCLGEKLSDDIFRPKDVELLSVFSHQAGMAIENARLYGEVKGYSETLEARVHERTERIGAMQESQSKFLADISHELQTPVAILKGNLEVLARRKVGERKSAMQAMTTTLDRMSRLVGSLLAVARLNFSKEKLHMQEIKVQNLLEEAYGDCFILAEHQGVTLSFSAVPFSIAGDKDKLKEVILNLISNALKHTPCGGAIALVGTPRDACAEIAVQDSGSGIPQENLPHIFERFYRINEGEMRGNGLGLNICRQIIEAHGGAIRAESEPGKGSRFIIAVPFFVPEHARPDEMP